MLIKPEKKRKKKKNIAKLDSIPSLSHPNFLNYQTRSNYTPIQLTGPSFLSRTKNASAINLFIETGGELNALEARKTEGTFSTKAKN